MKSSRRSFVSAGIAFASVLLQSNEALAFSASRPSSTSGTVSSTGTDNDIESNAAGAVAYRPLLLDMDEFGVRVPVAMWYPTEETVSFEQESGTKPVTYDHRISVKKIGELLAGWDFIPGFACRDFRLTPSLPSVIDGSHAPVPGKAPVVFLAHGYLGSRFDMSHLAEALAQQGFVCVSAEYPESLAASYPRLEGLDRTRITNTLLAKLNCEWGVQATSYGIVGHSLGCGTAISTGDDTWARVLVAGFPRMRDGSPIPGSILLLTSMNDGAVSLSRFGGKSAIPSDFVQLEEASLRELSNIPSRAALVFDRPDAPNHISYLSDGVNTAMIDLLSPLLPIAQAMSIPVLDFDKYKVSRDSSETAEVVIPLVSSYLKEHMKVR